MPPYCSFSANAGTLSSLAGTVSRERTEGSKRRSGFIFSGKGVKLFRSFRARPDPEVSLAAAVYITGVAGFIGSHVAEALLVRGDRVFGLDHLDPFYDRSLTERNLAAPSDYPGFRFTEGDIRDEVALRSWGDGSPADALIHLAAKAGARPSVADTAG